jgi:hypothetical protein
MVGSDEYHYKERTFGRNALTVYTWVHTTGVITLAGTYALEKNIGVAKGDIISLPNNKKGLVTVVTWSASANSSTITVIPQTGVSFAAGDATAGDTVCLQSPFWTDGMNEFNHYDRVETVDRKNFIQFFNRNRRWGVVEMQKMMNMGVTDYMMHDKENSIEQFRADLFASWLGGVMGEAVLPGTTSGNYYGKMMNGVYPTMVAAGAPSTSCTTSALQPALENLAFSTNRLAKGKTRILMGTPQMLHELVKVFKNPIQYAPNDQVANLNLKAYEFGEMRFVPVSCDLMGDTSMFPAFFGRMILGLDMNTIKPCHMKGLPKIMVGQTENIANGNNPNGYTDWYVWGNFGMKYYAPASGFIINVL